MVQFNVFDDDNFQPHVWPGSGFAAHLLEKSPTINGLE